MYLSSANTSYTNNLTGAFGPPPQPQPLLVHLERERSSEAQLRLRGWLIELCLDDVSVCGGSFADRFILYATKDFIATLDRTDRNNALLREALTALAGQNTQLIPDSSGSHAADFYFKHNNTEYRARLQYEKENANHHITQGKITCLDIYKGNDLRFSSADPHGLRGTTPSTSAPSTRASALQVTALVSRQSMPHTNAIHPGASGAGAPAGGALVPAHQPHMATLLMTPGLNDETIYEALLAPTFPSLYDPRGSVARASRVRNETERQYEKLVAFLASQNPPLTVVDCLKDFKAFSIAKKAYREIDISASTTSFMEALRDRCFVLPSMQIAERIQNERKPRADVRTVASDLDELLAQNDTSIGKLIATKDARRFAELRTEFTRGMNGQCTLSVLLRHINDIYFSKQEQ